jgi:hypothetical protein
MTVPSMNAMLEPRIVAARTHDRDFSAQGAPTFPARITAASHGYLIVNLDAYRTRADSDVSRNLGAGFVE